MKPILSILLIALMGTVANAGSWEPETIKEHSQFELDFIIHDTYFILGDRPPEKYEPRIKKDKNLKDGVQIIRYGDGRIKEKIPWRNSELHGVWQSWYKNGAQESEYQYLNGVKHGKWRWWYRNGKLKEETPWKEGKKHGPEIYWYDNGQVASHINYQDDLMHGKCTHWYETGQKKYESNYVNDQQQGDYYEWSEDGRMTTHQPLKEPDTPQEKPKPGSLKQGCASTTKKIIPSPTFTYSHPPIPLPDEIGLGKPFPSQLCNKYSYLVFFSSTMMNYYQLYYKGNRFTITSEPPSEGEQACIHDILIDSSHTRTPEGISIGEPLKRVMMIPGTELEKWQGFGYWVTLPSGWQAIFYLDGSTTDKPLAENTKVATIALRKH